MTGTVYFVTVVSRKRGEREGGERGEREREGRERGEKGEEWREDGGGRSGSSI